MPSNAPLHPYPELSPTEIEAALVRARRMRAQEAGVLFGMLRAWIGGLSKGSDGSRDTHRGSDHFGPTGSRPAH